jgi:hypothetical protein
MPRSRIICHKQTCVVSSTARATLIHIARFDCEVSGQPDCAAYFTIERVLYPLGEISVNV